MVNLVLGEISPLEKSESYWNKHLNKAQLYTLLSELKFTK